ncbi:MAG: single-strand DNA-binding protein [Flavobacteriaceae bacterium]|jgi:single-strand DNA-binding protein
MNTLRNKVSLIGRLGAAPEVVKLEGGKALTRFSIATNESYKDKKGEWQENTQWHTINAWGTNAELSAKLLAKGHEIAIEGKIVHNTYETKTGEKRNSTSIEMREFLLLTPREDAKQ